MAIKLNEAEVQVASPVTVSLQELQEGITYRLLSKLHTHPS